MWDLFKAALGKLGGHDLQDGSGRFNGGPLFSFNSLRRVARVASFYRPNR